MLKATLLKLPGIFIESADGCFRPKSQDTEHGKEPFAISTQIPKKQIVREWLVLFGGADCRAGGLIKQIAFRWCLVSSKGKVLGGGKLNCSARPVSGGIQQGVLPQTINTRTAQDAGKELTARGVVWRELWREGEMEAEVDKGISRGGARSWQKHFDFYAGKAPSTEQKD